MCISIYFFLGDAVIRIFIFIYQFQKELYPSVSADGVSTMWIKL